MAGFWHIWIVLSAVVTALAIFAMVRQHRARGAKRAKGTSPSQDGTLAGGGMDGGRGGHNHYVVIPRDPKEYARAMSPKK